MRNTLVSIGRNIVFLSFVLIVCSKILGQGQKIAEIIPDNSYGEIADRLTCLNTEIPLNFNKKVMAFIDYFSIKNREYTKGIIAKKELYFPLFSEILKKHNLPDELKYLSIVESGLKADAVSRANAVGLWQFIYTTGKTYGLKSNWYIDERMDPYKSTDAAARFLKHLYNTFGNWELALSAYNCGAGNVRKAIRRSGYKKDFWTIYRYLPRETRSYVPQYVAITYLLNHLEEHNFEDQPEYFMPMMDTIAISQYFHLETFCQQIEGCCQEDLLMWNPSIKRGALPEYTKNFTLRIPIEWKDSIVANKAFLYDTASKVGKKRLKYLAKKAIGNTYGRQKISYIVRRGDVLGTISRRYRVRISDLKRWNGLRSNLIQVGQRLTIWVLPSYNTKTKKLYASTRTHSTPSKVMGNIDGRKKVSYVVKKGDALSTIAGRYNVRISDLKRWNRLRSNLIQVGQRLTIWVLPNNTKKLYASTRTYSTPSKVMGNIDGREKISYVVKKEDALSTIAGRYNVRISDLKRWNRLRSNLIRVGQRLTIWVLPNNTKKLYASTRTYSTPSKVMGNIDGRKKVSYVVKKGDALSTIAGRYNVRISDLKRWNRLRSNLIQVGQRLNIWVLPNNTKNLYASTYTQSKTTGKTNLSAGKKTYHIRSGDSLWQISKEHNTTIEKLKKANKLTTNVIKTGQILIIPK